MGRVTVMFEFNSADEAIVFLGKQVDDPSAAVVVTPRAPAPQPAAQSTVEKRGRGRPKKANTDKTGAAGEGSPSPAQAPAAPAQAPAASAVTSAAEAAAPAQPAPATTGVPSKEDLVAAMQAILDNKSVDAVMAVLAKYGVESAGQLPEEKRAEFIAYCGKVAKGEVEAGK